MNMKEIKDIAQWEEADSELAKYNIQKLSSENYRYKSYMENIEQVNKYLYKRIDKAIEYIERQREDYNNGGNDMSYYQTTQLLDILRGEDNGSN